MRRAFPLAFLVIAVLMTLLLQPYLSTFAAGVSAPTGQNCRSFTQTGKQICGKFLTYWQDHGGLAQQGYPISDELQEKSSTDGKTYTVQYFERAVFELHPDNNPPYDVLLSLLGSSFYKQKYNGNAPGQHASTDNPRLFAETGKTIGGVFRQYWEQHGALAQQGFPLSDEFQERSATDGKTYTVQYFQRAVFEYHPEYAGTPNQVQLSLLGTFFYKSKYVTQPTPTPGPTGATSQVAFYTGGVDVLPVLVDEQGKLFFQKKFQISSNPYTQIVGRGQGKVLIYNDYRFDYRAGTLDTNGNYDLKDAATLGGGYNQVAAVDNNTLVFFNTSTAQMRVLREGVNGFVTTYNAVISNNSTSYYSRAKMVSPGMGQLLFYLPGTPQAIVVTGKIDADGKYVAQQTTTTTAGWQFITGTATNYVLFYNPATGATSFATIGSDGSFAAHPPFALEPGWTNILGLSNGVLLFHEYISGKVATRRVDYYSGHTDLQMATYAELDQIWPLAAAVR